MGDTLALAADLISRAQRGGARDAVVRAEQALAAGPGPDPATVALQFALAVAESELARWDDAETASTRCISTAVRMGSPGWQVNALALRAQLRLAQGRTEEAVEDMVDGEVLLEMCDDRGLRNWAHAALGSAYQELRCYELALPHFQRAVRITEQPIPFPDSLHVDLFNLADLHLSWADELERVGLDTPERVAEHDEHVAQADEWTTEAQSGPAASHSSPWSTGFALLRASIDARLTPASALEGLTRLRDSGLESGRRDDAAMAGAALSRALRSLGDLEASDEAVHGAIDLLQRETLTSVALAVHHQAHETALALDRPGAREAAAYLRLSARLLWDQRLRTVAGTRARRDYALLARAHAEAARIAREDPLTGLANRRGLHEALAQMPTGPASLVVVDVDDFKAVNDTHGHGVGDEVLVRLGGAVRDAARGEDVVARWGGDEFVVLMRDGHDVARLVTDRISRALATLDWSATAPGLRVGASVGWASAGPGELTGDLLARADREMFGAKRRKPQPPTGAVSWSGSPSPARPDGPRPHLVRPRDGQPPADPEERSAPD